MKETLESLEIDGIVVSERRIRLARELSLFVSKDIQNMCKHAFFGEVFAGDDICKIDAAYKSDASVRDWNVCSQVFKEQKRKTARVPRSRMSKVVRRFGMVSIVHCYEDDVVLSLITEGDCELSYQKYENYSNQALLDELFSLQAQRQNCIEGDFDEYFDLEDKEIGVIIEILRRTKHLDLDIVPNVRGVSIVSTSFDATNKKPMMQVWGYGDITDNVNVDMKAVNFKDPLSLGRAFDDLVCHFATDFMSNFPKIRQNADVYADYSMIHKILSGEVVIGRKRDKWC